MTGKINIDSIGILSHIARGFLYLYYSIIKNGYSPNLWNVMIIASIHKDRYLVGMENLQAVFI